MTFKIWAPFGMSGVFKPQNPDFLIFHSLSHLFTQEPSPLFIFFPKSLKKFILFLATKSPIQRNPLDFTHKAPNFDHFYEWFLSLEFETIKFWVVSKLKSVLSESRYVKCFPVHFNCYLVFFVFALIFAD